MTRQPHRRPARSAYREALPDGPQSVEVARSAGWTRSAQRHAVAVGDLERLRRGVLDVPLNAPEDTYARAIAERANVRRARAASLRCQRAGISHASAAIAYGIPTIGDLSRACLTVTAGTALRDLADVHLHRATLLDDDIVDVAGYPTTAPARTVMDVARERGVAAGVVAADYVLHKHLVTRDELAHALQVCSRWPGRRAARITFGFADERAESPLESLSRLKLVAHRLPRPRPQAWIYDEHGVLLGRSDFYWDEFGVVGECDGNLKYAGDPAVIDREKQREKAFESTGLIVVRWGWSDLGAFDNVVLRLQAAYRRGYPPGSKYRRWRIGLHP